MIALLALALVADVEESMIEARAKYDAIAYDEALAVLEGALQAPDVGPADRARLFAFIGLVRAQMADEPGARRAFDEAFALDRCVALPDAAAPPSILRLFAVARATLPPTPTPAPPPPPPPPPPQPPDAPAWPLTTAAVLGGVGAATLAAAMTFGLLALVQHGEALAAPVQVEAARLERVAQDEALTANVLLVLGAALVVGGAASAAVALAPLDDPEEVARGLPRTTSSFQCGAMRTGGFSPGTTVTLTSSFFAPSWARTR